MLTGDLVEEKEEEKRGRRERNEGEKEKVMKICHSLASRTLVKVTSSL